MPKSPSNLEQDPIAFGRSPTPLPALLYHALHRDQEKPPPRVDPTYAIPEKKFCAQLDLFARSGFRSLLPNELPCLPPAATKILFLSFDDGNLSDLEIALPCLLQHGQRATFFIIAGRIGRDGCLDSTAIRQLHEQGMAIGSHGWSHTYLTTLPLSRLREELRTSRRSLEDCLGAPIHALSMPGGRWNHCVVREALEAGYRYLFTSETPSGVQSLDGGAFLVHRVAIRRQTSLDWLVRLLESDLRLLRRLRCSSRLRRQARRLLGEHGYEWLRRFILRLPPEVGMQS